MRKLQIAVFFGGCSPEYGVSLESAYSVIRNLDADRYETVMVGISKAGAWYRFMGDIEKIKQDRWLNSEDCAPAMLSPSRGEHRLLLIKNNRIVAVPVDAAFPVMHGSGGEDGSLQGLIELAGIPLVGCGVLASALCMDKDRAHKLARLAGIDAPEALVIRDGDSRQNVTAFAQKIGYPLFVKPVKAGSSYGVSKVTAEPELFPAIELAFHYDNEVILEENVEGFEVGCAVMGCEQLVVGEVDEIELSGGFFDFAEKYTLKTSAIHLPARISSQTADRIKETAKTLYRVMGCSGFARVDMFLTPDGRIVFNEINTIPGFTEHSRYPGMMQAAGFSFPQVLDQIIGLAVKE